MLAWIIENGATALISIMLIAAVALILTRMIKNKKQGKSACGCGCSGCPMEGACHQKK